MNDTKQYIAIDLKSFYASVECIERGLNPLTTNLVVADESRTEKTICLAVSPSLKAHGISGRSRLFEVVQKVKDANLNRRHKYGIKEFEGSSVHDLELKNNPNLAIDYIIAPPRMAHYIEYSTKIYEVYLKYIAPEDIHVYSIDEVFIELTPYLHQKSAYELTNSILQSIFNETGITATAGIGTNLYLAKIAMDIVAKNQKGNTPIAILDEISYREKLWSYKPLSHFWRIGKGYEKKLNDVGIYTMGDIAKCSLGEYNNYYNEGLLFKLFGKNAELLIDHAWGYEPCTMADIKSYKPSTNSISSGQVLQDPYTFDKARIVVWEMADSLSLDLLGKKLVTNKLTLTVGYDKDNLLDPNIADTYVGEITVDNYDRKIPKHSHSTITLDEYTFSSHKITDAILELFDKIVNKNLLIRRLTIACLNVVSEDKKPVTYKSYDLFTDFNEDNKKSEKEEKIQKTLLAIKEKYGKNAIIKARSLEEGATMKSRNEQIGGHKA